MRKKATTARYNATAISLHWLIAFFLFGLLAVGKYMTGLDEADPLRYSLTQWHKSFGIVVLLLAVFRVIWRVSHRPPALPSSSTLLERFGSHATHLALYLLMVVIPISGWVMVSLSPLNLKTLLFGIIPWPHLAFLTDIPNKQQLAELSIDVHIWLANTMMLLILLHVLAALFHQFFKRDQLLSRMVISAEHRDNNDLNHGLVLGFLMALGGGMFLFDASQDNNSGIVAGAIGDMKSAEAADTTASSTVGFKAKQMGEPVVGRFESAQVQLSLDAGQLNAATLTASVITGSVNSGDSQIDGTVVTEDWFDSKNHPEATFTATGFSVSDESSYNVVGDLMIKGIVNPINFQLTLVDGIGRGEFVVNRSDFKIGDDGQDEFVDKEVVINFEVANNLSR